MNKITDLDFDGALDENSPEHKALLKEAQLAKRHVSIQFKLDGIRNKGKGYQLDVFDKLEVSIKNLSQIDDKNNFRDTIKSLDLDKDIPPHSHYFGQSIQNQLIMLHNLAAEEEVYGETLYMKLLELKSQHIICDEDVERLFILSLEWPLDI